MHYNTAFCFLLALGHRGMKDMRTQNFGRTSFNKSSFQMPKFNKKEHAVDQTARLQYSTSLFRFSDFSLPKSLPVSLSLALSLLLCVSATEFVVLDTEEQCGYHAHTCHFSSHGHKQSEQVWYIPKRIPVHIDAGKSRALFDSRQPTTAAPTYWRVQKWSSLMARLLCPSVFARWNLTRTFRNWVSQKHWDRFNACGPCNCPKSMRLAEGYGPWAFKVWFRRRGPKGEAQQKPTQEETSVIRDGGAISAQGLFDEKAAAEAEAAQAEQAGENFAVNKVGGRWSHTSLVHRGWGTI